MRHGNICRRSYNSARFLRPLHHYFIVFITFISFLHLCEGLSYIDCLRLLECSVLQPITAIRLIFISLPPLSPRGYLAYQSYLSSVQEGKTSVIATWATYGHCILLNAMECFVRTSNYAYCRHLYVPQSLIHPPKVCGSLNFKQKSWNFVCLKVQVLYQ